MNLLWGKPTGFVLWNGMPHRQPTPFRRLLCRARHGKHRPKFGMYPRGACIHCRWLRDA